MSYGQGDEIQDLKAEIARLREDNERMMRNHNNIVIPMVEKRNAEIARLRKAWQQLIDIAGESETGTMYAATVIDIARAALKETEERSRVIFERDAYEGSGA